MNTIDKLFVPSEDDFDYQDYMNDTQEDKVPEYPVHPDYLD